MKQAVYSSRTADKFVVRLPEGMREQIADKARTHHRSMNSQIVATLAKDLDIEYIEEPVEGQVGFQIHIGMLVNYEDDRNVVRPGVITNIRIFNNQPRVYFGHNDSIHYGVERIKPHHIVTSL